MTKEERREFRAYLEKHRDYLNKEVDAIRQRASELGKVLYELSKLDPADGLQCHKQLPAQDMICIGCDKARPVYANGQFLFPGRGFKFELSAQETQERTCEEWRKKQVTAICGCGGTYTCKCGYRESVCFPHSGPCPFCGRALHYEDHRPAFAVSYNLGGCRHNGKGHLWRSNSLPAMGQAQSRLSFAPSGCRRKRAL